MTSEQVAHWMVQALALIGAGVALAAGLLAAAAAIKVGVLVMRTMWLEAILWRDLREAVDEWKAKHPDKAARYDGEGPWRNW